MSRIKLTTCESGDGEILELDGEIIASSHNINNYDWIELLNKLGYEVEEEEISDEEMEERW